MKGATLRTGVSPTKTVEVMAEEVDTTTDKEATTEVMAAVEDISHQEEAADTESVVATKIIEEGVAAMSPEETEVAGETNRAAIVMVEEETTNRMTAAMETHTVEIRVASRAQAGVEALSGEVGMAARISDQELRKVLLAMHHLWGTGIRPKGAARALMSTLAT